MMMHNTLIVTNNITLILNIFHIYEKIMILLIIHHSELIDMERTCLNQQNKNTNTNTSKSCQNVII